MSKKPVTLALHKSQIERQKRKIVRAAMVANARDMGSRENIVAFALVGLSDTGDAYCAWDTGGAIPMWAFPQTVAEILRADLDTSGIEDHFKKPVLDRSWRGAK